jgi:uncharacterized protein
MDSPDLRDLLDSTHTFPGPFVFKAVGFADENFVVTVVSVVRATLGHDFDPPFETRQTPTGRHVSVTITPWVESSDDVLRVYARIREIPDLVFLL